MDYFYDGQMRRYLAQFMQLLSNFAYKDAKGQLVQVPVRYGDMNRQVSQILKKNSENTIPSAPFISCYIKDLKFDRPRLQDPTFVSKVQIKERAYDANGNAYLNTQGSNYTVERIMPTPYLATFSADIWTTNTEMKLQLWEQIVIFFNPTFEIQTTDNYIDWTSLSYVELTNTTWSSRSIPQGLSEDIDILSLQFETPVWITPPAKVKKLGVITKIISNIYATPQGTIANEFNTTAGGDNFTDLSPDTSIIITPGDYSVLIMNNTAQLVKPSASLTTADPTTIASASWFKILDLYPGKFRAGLSQIRFTKPDGNEIVAYISLNPDDDFTMHMNIDIDTVPSNTTVAGRGTVDAVINPETFNPGAIAAGTRYIITEGININSDFGQLGYDGPHAWKNLDQTDFQAQPNDIIEWNGSSWAVVLASVEQGDVIYITNSYTGTQYKLEDGYWSKSYEGVYDPQLWRLVL